MYEKILKARKIKEQRKYVQKISYNLFRNEKFM